MAPSPRSDAADRLPRQSGPSLVLGLAGAAAVAVVALLTRGGGLESRPLWYDELFTWYVATRGSVSEVVRALLAGADNGPPVDYLARHLTMLAMGESVWALRLPSVLGFAATMACVISLGRRLASWPGAIAAGLVLWSTAAAVYATEARSYALMAALSAAVLWAWCRATDRPGSRLRLFVLFATLFASPLTHYYGVLNFVPVMAGETLRTLQRRRIDRGVLAAILAALLSLPVALLFARHAWEMRAHFWAGSFGLGSIGSAYDNLLGSGLVAMGGLVAATSLLYVVRRGWRRVRFTALEGAVLVLAATPVTLFVIAKLATHAMTARYALAGCVGVALLAAVCARILDLVLARAAWGVVAVSLVMAFFVPPTLRDMPSRGFGEELLAFVRSADTAVAVDSPQDYLRLFRTLEDDSGLRLFYPVDREASRRHLGFDNDELAITQLATWVGLRAPQFEVFLAENADFDVLVGENPYWLLAELRERGIPIDAGTRVGAMRLYRVRRGPDPLNRNDD